jgi:predicted HTH transcriptional regulator
LAVPRSAEALNIHLIGGSSRWYDFHLEDRRACIGQERVLDSAGSKPIDVQALETALRQGEGERIEFKEYIREANQKEAEIVKVIVAFANTKGGTIFLGVSDGCELLGTDVELCNKFPGAGGDLEKALNDYMGYLRGSLPEKMNHCPELDFKVVRTGGHRILAITVQEGIDRIYMRRSDNGIFVRRGSSCAQADADYDIPRLVGQRLGRQWQVGDAMDW